LGLGEYGEYGESRGFFIAVARRGWVTCR
jgi:hypothetical protein